VKTNQKTTIGIISNRRRPSARTTNSHVFRAPSTAVVYEIVPTPRRGLNRTEAAAYIGVSPSKFDEMVRDGRMCAPKRIDARVIWDIRQLDAAFDSLPSELDDAQNPWDEP
jgi:hypothetical protein